MSNRSLDIKGTSPNTFSISHDFSFLINSLSHELNAETRRRRAAKKAFKWLLSFVLEALVVAVLLSFASQRLRVSAFWSFTQMRNGNWKMFFEDGSTFQIPPSSASLSTSLE